MECGDLSPPWTGRFIGPQRELSSIRFPENGEMNFA
jgi:hypothetical protein